MSTGSTITRIIVAVVVVGLIGGLGFFGWQYYMDRYVGTDYYARVPLNYDVTPKTMHSDDGTDLGPGKEYTLKAYNLKGELRELNLTVYAPGSTMASARELPRPGEYLCIKASRQIVISWQTVPKSAVPSSLVERLG